jgi:ABC-type bacteriocin/lantibiotic exporter with double-glycine peptidase domain
MVRAMVRRPLVLLLDEPTAHLDADSAALVERAIDALTMTRIVATHRPFDAEHSVSLSDGVRHGV